MKRDLEYAAVRNQGSTAGAAASARTMASVESWLFTNRTDIGSGGAPTTPGFISGLVAAPTDNSASGTFVESHLQAIVKAAWNQGGEPKVVLVGPFNKQRLSGFSGVATQYNPLGGSAKPGTIIGAADTYVSNFGTLKVYPDRFSRDATVLVLDMDYWALAWLRPWFKEKLGKTGDAEIWDIRGEVTLESRNEAASGKITTCTTS